MGLILKRKRDELLAGCKKELRKIIKGLDSLNDIEFKYFIIVLANFLYLYYCTYDTLSDGDYYDINSRTIMMYISNTKLSIIVNKIVACRNLLCHETGMDGTALFVEDLKNNIDTVKFLLKELNVIKEDKDKDGDDTMVEKTTGLNNLVNKVEIN